LFSKSYISPIFYNIDIVLRRENIKASMQFQSLKKHLKQVKCLIKFNLIL